MKMIWIRLFAIFFDISIVLIGPIVHRPPYLLLSVLCFHMPVFRLTTQNVTNRYFLLASATNTVLAAAETPSCQRLC